MKAMYGALKSLRSGAAILLCTGTFAVASPASERIDLDKTTIKGNAELPKYLYVVPWRDKTKASLPEKKLRLHDLYGDLFDPVKPDYNSSPEVTAETANPTAGTDSPGGGRSTPAATDKGGVKY